MARNESLIVVDRGGEMYEYEMFRVGGKSYICHEEDGHAPELIRVSKTKDRVRFTADGDGSPLWDVYKFTRTANNTLSVIDALRLLAPNHRRARKAAA